MKTFVIGDIHGNHKGLVQCLERSEFDRKNDMLITLGDIADGYDEVYQCVEELLTIKNRIDIRGNHDDWFRIFMNTCRHPDMWLQGGFATAVSYARVTPRLDTMDFNTQVMHLTPTDIPLTHWKFFSSQGLYYVDEKKRCFVHGGFNRHKELVEQKRDDPKIFYWDRDLWLAALSFKEMPVKEYSEGKKYKFKIKDDFTEVFIGHTGTVNWNKTVPMKAANITNVDTGSGRPKGKLTIMDVDTHKFWQSDFCKKLYPTQQGR